MDLLQQCAQWFENGEHQKIVERRNSTANLRALITMWRRQRTANCFGRRFRS